jgi:hypothetical protein
MPFRFHAFKKRTGKLTEGQPRETLERAIKDAAPFLDESKVVTILRAEIKGINKGKYFLCRILK